MSALFIEICSPNHIILKKMTARSLRSIQRHQTRIAFAPRRIFEERIFLYSLRRRRNEVHKDSQRGTLFCFKPWQFAEERSSVASVDEVASQATLWYTVSNPVTGFDSALFEATSSTKGSGGARCNAIPSTGP
jgi:hypothetical protein